MVLLQVMIALVIQKSGSFPFLGSPRLLSVGWRCPHCLWDGDVLTADLRLTVCAPCQAVELNLGVGFGRDLGVAITLSSLKQSSNLHLNVSYGSWEGDMVWFLPMVSVKQCPSSLLFPKDATDFCMSLTYLLSLSRCLIFFLLMQWKGQIMTLETVTSCSTKYRRFVAFSAISVLFELTTLWLKIGRNNKILLKITFALMRTRWKSNMRAFYNHNFISLMIRAVEELWRATLIPKLKHERKCWVTGWL